MTLPNSTPQHSAGLYMQSFVATNNTTVCFIFYAFYKIIFNAEIHNASFNLKGFWRRYSRDWNCQHRSLSKAKLQNDTTFLRPDMPPSSGWKWRTYCDGTVRNSWSFPWSKPTKVGSPVYPLHLKMEANKISETLCCLRRWIKPRIKTIFLKMSDNSLSSTPTHGTYRLWWTDLHLCSRSTDVTALCTHLEEKEQTLLFIYLFIYDL